MRMVIFLSLYLFRAHKVRRKCRPEIYDCQQPISYKFCKTKNVGDRMDKKCNDSSYSSISRLKLHFTSCTRDFRAEKRENMRGTIFGRVIIPHAKETKSEFAIVLRRDRCQNIPAAEGEMKLNDDASRARVVNPTLQLVVNRVKKTWQIPWHSAL